MKVLSVASEVFPLVKTGGLADVAGALPLALKAQDVDVVTLLPGYPAVIRAIENPVLRLTIPELFGVEARVLEAKHHGLDLLVLDIPAFYDRPGGPYIDAAGKDHADNWKRFAALSKAGAAIAQGAWHEWKPDLVHVHDWQSAMVPVYMRYALEPEIPSLITIHNIAFQGQFGPEIVPYLGLPSHAYWESLEYYGSVSFLKAGLMTAHALSTVSPSYAEEILTAEFGMGLEGVIASRADDLYGIVNGIDAAIWNPASDPFLASPFASGSLKGRAANKKALLQQFALDDGDDAPVFSIISRLTWQKGMDVLIDVVDDIVAMGGRLTILGTGDPLLEEDLLAASIRHKGKVGMTPAYNEPLSHLMQGGSDALIVPSRFEPCGLTQLYALRYGCVPIVARTGGLNDTVIDANEAALISGAATGIQFSPVTSDGLRQAVRRAFRLYGQKDTWGQMQKQGMKSDVSWGRSADRYAELYKRLALKGH